MGEVARRVKKGKEREMGWKFLVWKWDGHGKRWKIMW